MSKYDWSKVPDEVNWIATDGDGVVNGFKIKPIINEKCRMWFESEDCTGYYFQIEIKLMKNSDWKNSLEERLK
ncbi:hypothetical protein Brutus_00053 [Acinetobacter phage Brutus]|nr:hypothetical protein Brutus_00053 [Acinetobacter phage Brutus]